MPRLRQKEEGPKRVRRVYKVVAPREATDESLAKFTANINAELSDLSQQLAKIPTKLPVDFDPEEYVREDTFEDVLDRIEEGDYDLATSEGEEAGVGQGRGKNARERRASRRRRFIEEAAQTAVEGAIPDAAPPKVADASAIGTTTSPVQFALEDHTHQGVNLDLGQTITGNKTFDRDPNAPFAVTSGSDTVLNLGAERARRAIMAFPLQAGITPVTDYGYRRHFLLMARSIGV